MTQSSVSVSSDKPTLAITVWESSYMGLVPEVPEETLNATIDQVDGSSAVLSPLLTDMIASDIYLISDLFVSFTTSRKT